MALSEYLANGVRLGLDICGAVLIPSLFPFLIFLSYLNERRVVEKISPSLCKMSKKLFKIGGEELAVFLISLLSGYPSGALLLSKLLIENERKSNACIYCCSGGITFIYTAVGIGILHNKKAGIILLISHIFSSIITLFLFSRTSKTKQFTTPNPIQSNGNLVGAVSGATQSMMTICAFTLTFAAISQLIGKLPLQNSIKTAICCLLEVTNGCFALSKITQSLPFYAATLGFGGISVILQICALCKSASFKHILIGRIFHAMVSFVVCKRICIFFPQAVQTAVITIAPVSYSAPFSLAMLLLCVVYCTSVYAREK